MKQYDIMFMNIITPLHNGSGEGVGIVDNSIMRERTTQFPVIQSTSIKGVLRDEYESSGYVIPMFGPDGDRVSNHAGAISLGDGNIFAFPVRSVKGCFVWVTSPLVLWRLYQKINIMGESINALLQLLNSLTEEIPSPSATAKICPSGSSEILFEIAAGDKKLLLEEFPIICKESTELENFTVKIGNLIFGDVNDNFLKNGFMKKLVVLDDDAFKYFVTNTTEIVANIKIGENGTTVDGSLRYTEYLPSETIMYSTLAFDKARIKGTVLGGAEIKEKFITHFPENVQIGGNETTGKGIVKLTLAGGNNSND